MLCPVIHSAASVLSYRCYNRILFVTKDKDLDATVRTCLIHTHRNLYLYMLMVGFRHIVVEQFAQACGEENISVWTKWLSAFKKKKKKKEWTRNTNICLETKIKEEAFLSVKSKLLTKIFKIVTMWLMMYCCYLLRISFDFDSNSSYSCYFVPFGIVCFCSAVLDSVRDCNVENCSVFYITKHVCLGWRNIRDGVSSGLRRCQDLCLRTVILIALWVAGESMLF